MGDDPERAAGILRGRSRLFAEFRSGQWFGEYALFWGGRRKATVQCETHSVLLSLHRRSFDAIGWHARSALRMVSVFRYVTPKERRGIFISAGLELLVRIALSV